MPDNREHDDEENQFRRARLDKLAGLQALGVDPYPYGFARSHDAATLERLYADLPNGAVTAERRRVMAAREAVRIGIDAERLQPGELVEPRAAELDRKSVV